MMELWIVAILLIVIGLGMLFVGFVAGYTSGHKEGYLEGKLNERLKHEIHVRRNLK